MLYALSRISSACGSPPRHKQEHVARVLWITWNVSLDYTFRRHTHTNSGNYWHVKIHNCRKQSGKTALISRYECVLWGLKLPTAGHSFWSVKSTATREVGCFALTDPHTMSGPHWKLWYHPTTVSITPFICLIYVHTNLSVMYLRVCQFTYLSIYLPTYLVIYPPTYLPTYQVYINLSTYLPMYLQTQVSAYLSIYLPTQVPIYLPTYVSTYLPIYLSIYLCV